MSFASESMKYTVKPPMLIPTNYASRNPILPTENQTLEVTNPINHNGNNLPPEPAETAQYHQIVRITLNPVIHQSQNPRVFIIHRSKLLALSGTFRKKVDDANDSQHWILQGIKPRIFEIFFHWVNTSHLKHATGALPTLVELAALWKLGEHLEVTRLQNSIMDYFCALHNEKELDAQEFGECIASLGYIGDGKLGRVLELVIQKYPDWGFFDKIFKDEIPRRRWMCLNMVWGDGSGREDWKILPDVHGLYVREHGEDEDLIEL